MSPFGCAREREVSELVERGQWPLAAPKDVREHAAGCRVCGDLVVVKQALQSARAEALAQPVVLPSASALWWRAQLRKRNEALDKIARPILGAEIFAAAVLVLVALCGLGWELRRGLDLRAWIGALHLSSLWPSSLVNFGGSLWFVAPMLAVLAVVSGVVVYFVSEKP
jgi:hypothetical protein